MGMMKLNQYLDFSMLQCVSIQGSPQVGAIGYLFTGSSSSVALLVAVDRSLQGHLSFLFSSSLQCEIKSSLAAWLGAWLHPQQSRRR